MAHINGTNQDDNLIGTDENDIITPKLGNDFVDGGAGIDTLVLDFSSLDFVDGYFDPFSSFSGFYNGTGAGGKFSNISFTSIERLNIIGSKGNDSFTGGVLNDVLKGGAGNDFLSGGAGDDTIDGGTGNDFLDGGQGNDLILGGSGDDFITSGGGADIINGGDGKDALLDADFSNSTKNLVFKDSGKTYGRLVLASGTIATNIEFLDVITTGRGNDQILYSRYRDNTIDTGDGNDIINPGLGYDSVDGGTGDDLLIIDHSSLNSMYGSTYGTSGYYSGSGASGYSSMNFYNIERLDVTGTSGNDVIAGLSGNDILRGGGGDDIIYGNGGVDFIDGGSGINGIGIDLSTTTHDLVFDDSALASGSITLPNGTVAVNVAYFASLTTGSGNDQVLFSDSYNNTINTGDGNDIIHAGLGNDSVDSGAGDDLLIIDYSSLNSIYSYVFGNGGAYFGYGTSNNSNVNFYNIERLEVIGTSGNDVILGLSGNDILNGGAGDDILDGNGGSDFIDGGAGIDGIGVYFSTSMVDLAFTSDTISNGSISLPNGMIAVNVEYFAKVTTGSGNDQVLFNSLHNNTINTSDGNDTINSGLGNDLVYGGAGDDLLIIDYSSLDFASINYTYGNNGFCNGYGASGNSSIYFYSIERLNVTGSSGNDFLNGLSGNDILQGGAGDDIIYGNGGLDLIDGGTGIDGIDVDFSDTTTDLVFTNDSISNGSISQPNGTVAVNVEYLAKLTTGSGNDQVLFSSSYNNLISTGDGDDIINAGLGYDSVYGGTGDDLLIIDYSVAGSVGSFVFDNSGSYSSFYPGEPGNVQFSDIERLDVTASAGNDFLYGGSGNDILRAGLGSDYVSAGGGDDWIQLGNDGFSDTVIYNFGDGADTIVGFEQGSTGDELFIDNIAAVDVVTTYNSSGWRTQVYLGDGISGNAGFGSGSLLATLTNTQLTTADVGINLRSNSGAQFLFA